MLKKREARLIVINEISIKDVHRKQFEDGSACGGSQALSGVIEDS